MSSISARQMVATIEHFHTLGSKSFLLFCEYDYDGVSMWMNVYRS